MARAYLDSARRRPNLAIGLDNAGAGSDEALAAYVREHVDTFGHALGTAPMGSPDDPDAVVSQRCQVHGVDNLSVVDASIMPAVPAVPPHLTTIMIAERAAGWLEDAAWSATAGRW